jgi:hypothetical protein
MRTLLALPSIVLSSLTVASVAMAAPGDPGAARSAADPFARPVVVSTTVQGDDIVRLRSGAMLRGRIAERSADGSAVLVLVTGEVRTLRGAEIDSVTNTATPTPPPEADLSDPRDELPILTRPAPGRVPVVFESPREDLQVGLSGGTTRTLNAVIETHETLCLTPCTLYVRPGMSLPYWSGGMMWNGLELFTGGTFNLAVPPEGLRVRLRAGARNGYTGGFMLTAFGGALTTAAGVTFALGVMDKSEPLTVIGGVALAGTLAMLTGGIVMLVQNRGGVASREPLRARAERDASALSVRLIGAPLPEGGAVAGLAIQF